MRLSRVLWLLLAFAGATALFYLLVEGGNDALGATNTPRLVYLAILGAVVAASVLGSGIPIGAMARNLAAWLAIALVLVAGYQYRYELQDVASRVTGGAIPGSPLSITDSSGHLSVRLDKGADGHFEARASINGSTIRVLVDTGATATVLTTADASAIGIDVSKLAFAVPVATANGQALAARAVAGEITIGTIKRRNLPVLVANASALDRSLLGMNFLGTLSGFDVRGDRMILYD